MFICEEKKFGILQGEFEIVCSFK